ncbi:hypothetical protein MHBDNKMI_02807 [Aeromonas jandaei]
MIGSGKRSGAVCQHAMASQAAIWRRNCFTYATDLKIPHLNLQQYESRRGQKSRRDRR